MHSVPRAMAQAAEKGGASLRYGEPVEVILRSPTRRVAGMGLESAARLRADAGVCTTDLPVAYETLLADLKPPRAAVRGRYSPSAAGSGTVPGVGVPMVLISGKLAAERVASYLPGPAR
jgi:phytoene desaturase